jgi:hypothetical protein
MVDPLCCRGWSESHAMYWLGCVGFLNTSNSSEPSDWRRMVRSSMLMRPSTSLLKVHLMFSWTELRKARKGAT